MGRALCLLDLHHNLVCQFLQCREFKNTEVIRDLIAWQTPVPTKVHQPVFPCCTLHRLHADSILTHTESVLNGFQTSRLNHQHMTQPSPLVCQKYIEKCKGAVKVCRSWKCVLLVNINVTKMYANCGLWNARCSFSKVEIISLAFKWLILLRSAIKMCNQTHRVLKNVFATF